MAKAVNEVGSTDIHKIISHLEDRTVETTSGSWKIRGYDHQLMIPRWSGTVAFTDDMPYPHIINLWRPEKPETLYRTVAEVKEARKKANNPYVNYLGH
jgi:hypothetical protein